MANNDMLGGNDTTNDTNAETSAMPENGNQMAPDNTNNTNNTNNSNNIQAPPFTQNGMGVTYPDQDLAGVPVHPILIGGRPVDQGPTIGGASGSCPTCVTGGFFPSWYPQTPVFPSIPNQNYAQVRFLNATTTSYPVNISIDNNNYAVNSRYGTITNYDMVSDGFHTVVVTRTSIPRTVLLRQTFSFAAGEKVTMVLVDSGAGMEIIPVTGTGCRNLPYNSGCYRIANMTYSGSAYDLMLYGGEVVFRNVQFGNVTSYKQAVANSYEFYVTNASYNSIMPREIAIIAIGGTGSMTASNEALVSFVVDIEPGKKYTTYLIGNNWSDYRFTALTVED